MESCAIIWSGPGFIVHLWGLQLIVIWSGSRIHNKLFEKLLSGWVQDLQIFEVDEVNCYLVGSRLHNKMFGDIVVIWSVSRLHNKSLRAIAIWSDPGFTTTCLN